MYQEFRYRRLAARTYDTKCAAGIPAGRGMSYTEEDWVDEDATGRRDLDD